MKLGSCELISGQVNVDTGSCELISCRVNGGTGSCELISWWQGNGELGEL